MRNGFTGPTAAGWRGAMEQAGRHSSKTTES
jgi:hypothetical protein